MRRTVAVTAALLAGLSAGCGGAPSEDRGAEAGAPAATATVEPGPEPVPDAPPIDFVGTEADGGHRALRFADGQVSLNDQCPVRRRGLSLRLPPVYVNGAPIGFC